MKPHWIVLLICAAFPACVVHHYHGSGTANKKTARLFPEASPYKFEILDGLQVGKVFRVRVTVTGPILTDLSRNATATLDSTTKVGFQVRDIDDPKYHTINTPDTYEVVLDVDAAAGGETTVEWTAGKICSAAELKLYLGKTDLFLWVDVGATGLYTNSQQHELKFVTASSSSAVAGTRQWPESRSTSITPSRSHGSTESGSVKPARSRKRYPASGPSKGRE